MPTSPGTGSCQTSRHGWQPPPDLEAFLAGDPPLYIGFGSTGFGKHAAAHGRSILDPPCRRSSCAGWGGINLTERPDQVLFVRDITHEWLLPRTAAVIHHGGAGNS
jgi:sterol 3beta-glucosyltransferase